MCSREHSASSVGFHIGEAIAPGFRRRVRALDFTEWRSAAELQSASKSTGGPGSTARRRSLWSTYDQPKLRDPSLGSRCMPGEWLLSDFGSMLLGATRAQTSGLPRCHRAAGVRKNGDVRKYPGVLRLSYTRSRPKAKRWSECRIVNGSSFQEGWS